MDETLPFGDAQIVGRGPEERPVLVGVEMKKIPDLLQSLTDGRLVGHQLPGMIDSYEIAYLLIIGNPLKLRGEWSFGTLMERLFGLENNTKLRLAWAPDVPSAAIWLSSLYRWWNGKAWESHRSHLVLRQKELEAEDPLGSFTNKVTRKMRVAAALVSGIGAVKARALSLHFPSVAAMMAASVEEFQTVDGIGPKLAKKLTGTIRTEEEI